MSKHNKVIYLLLLLNLMLIVGCGNKYYKNIRVKNLKTFESITDVKVTTTEETADNSKFVYLLENGTSGLSNMYKYEQYLREEGFERSTYFSTADTEYYIKEDDVITLHKSILDSVIEYTITFEYYNPDNPENGSGSNDADSQYEEMIELTKAGKYDDAIEFWNSSYLSEDFEGYKDSKKYFFYCEAMNYLNDTYYGDALTMLKENCMGILDVDQKIIEIESIVKPYEGVYKNKSIDYMDVYFFIKDGMVTYSQSGIPSEAIYNDSLCTFTSTSGTKPMAVGSGILKSIDYVITTGGSGEIVAIIAYEGGYGSSALSGAYSKTSDRVPEFK